MMKSLGRIKNIKKMHDLILKEDLDEFRNLLEEEKDKDLDLNTVITIHKNEDNINFYQGDLGKNWEKLFRVKWNGTRYTGKLNDDCIYSQTVYEMLKGENSGEIEKIINEIYPDFEAENKKSIVLTLDDLVTEGGFLKVTMIDEKYLITEDEKYGFEDWLKTFENVMYTDILQDEYKIKARDVLEDKEVEFSIKANQYEKYEIFNRDLGFINMELVK